MRVSEVFELVAEDGPDPELGRAAARDVDRMLRVCDRGRLDDLDLGAESAHHLQLLLGDVIRRDQQAFVAGCACNQRQAHAGAALRRLDQRPARQQLAACRCLAYHLERDPILATAARVEEFGLAEDGASGRVRERSQMHQRRATDQVQHTLRRDEVGAPAPSPLEPRCYGERDRRGAESDSGG